VRVHVRVRERACVRASVCACVCVRVCMQLQILSVRVPCVRDDCVHILDAGMLACLKMPRTL